MGIERLASLPQISSETVRTSADLCPMEIDRTATGALRMFWDVSTEADPRTAAWETTLEAHSDGIHYTLASKYFAVDPDRTDLRESISITIRTHKFGGHYEVIAAQQRISSLPMAQLLQAVRTGVELYTTYKELTVREQAAYADQIIDESTVPFDQDEVWKRITYIFGVRKKPDSDTIIDTGE